MFPQNLPKKLSEIFSKDSIKNLIINSFKELMIIIGSIGLLIIIIIVFVLSGRCGKETLSERVPSAVDEGIKNMSPAAFGVLPSDLIIPSIKTFDVSVDHIEFLPTRRLGSPDIEILKGEEQKLIKEAIKESYLFNFEKRKRGGGE